MLTKKSRLLLTLTAATPLLFAACTDNGIFNPLQDASGTYQLTVYAGKTIPATFTINPGDPNFPEAPNGGTFVVTDGTLVLQNNGSFVETNNYTITPNGQSGQAHQFVSSGTWNLNGTSFSLSDQQLQRFDTGTLDTDANGRLTVNYTEDAGNGQFQSFEYKR
ncbi:MAG TPA: hypothetical protein VK478_09610 [Gemmatimonadaceae bacterium]|jgi:hypothetical protein|nr:hypothetical protein [Gemmatimonadaceae bacterium]